MVRGAEFNPEKIFAGVEVNPQLGAQVKELATWMENGIEMARVAVRIRPEQAIRTHLHTCNDEEMIAHTRIILALGDAKKNEAGEYVTLDNKDGEPEVLADNWQFFVLYPGDRMPIIEGKTHYIANTEKEYGYAEFALPRAHFDVNTLGGVDRKWVVSPSVPSNL